MPQPSEEPIHKTMAHSGSSISFELDREFHRLVVETWFTGSDGNPNRLKVYDVGPKRDAYVVFLDGRDEFLEKYDVLFTSLHEFPVDGTPADQTFADLPITFVAPEHNGQGASTEGRLQNHIDDYELFIADAQAVVDAVELLNLRDKPLYIASHSMGGLVAATIAQRNPDVVDGLILGSPLLKVRPVPGLPEPALRFVANFYAVQTGMSKLCTAPQGIDTQTLATVALCAGGLIEDQLPGCQACFNSPDGCGVPQVQALQGAFAYLQSIGDQGCPPSTYSCPAPHVSSDDAYCEYVASHPLHGPEATFGWLNATFAAIDALNVGPDIQARTLILTDPQDQVVDPSAHTCAKFSGDCTVLPFAGYGHEMFTAADRQDPIAAAREFLGY